MHEQLQVLRGNIRVCCRVRPCLRWVWGGAGWAGHMGGMLGSFTVLTAAKRRLR